jgi:DNA helicase II / ATP-dependent DNA helicase PcrA
MKYTPHQQEAINHLDGNLQIIACAGSGKTQVISQRIINILREKASEGVRPANIVAFTFTDKAAGELKNRIHKLANDQLGSDFGLAEMYVGTIHGFCLNLLQTYLFKYLKYSVLSDVQQRLLIDRHNQESGLRSLTTLDGKPLKQFVDSRLYQKILSIVREANIDEGALGDHPVRAALAKYNDLLDKKRYLDYSRILLEAVTALAGDEALRKIIGERVKYLIVDEYQDVNPLQECLIRLFHDLGAQLCVVGDDDQTIYQWNGSDINNILTFKDRYPGVRQIPMAENFRSSKGVVETARNVVERNRERLPKNMESMEKQPFARGDLLCLRFQTPEEEARWVVEKLGELRGVSFAEQGVTRGLCWSDCAILLRSVKNSAGPIVEALRAANIPYIVKGMTGLFDTVEAQAAVGIFYYLNGDISRADLISLWENADLNLDKDCLSFAVDGLDAGKSEWPDERRKSNYGLQRTYLAFLDALDLREEGIPDDGGAHLSRGELIYFNQGKFSQIITDFEQIHFHSDPYRLHQGFAGFLRHQARDYYPEGWEGAGYATPDAVQIMTVHQSKGMEFPVVFVPNLLKNRFPAKGHGSRQWYHVIPRQAVIDSQQLAGGEEDERRLFYVAMTRSKKFLYCTWAPDMATRDYKNESIFIREVTTPGHVLTRDPLHLPDERLDPEQGRAEAEVSITFSELKYFFECPYQFKLRFLYGFNAPVREEMGFGKSLHDALAEVHSRAIAGDYTSRSEVSGLVERHLHLPFANPRLMEQMKVKSAFILDKYLVDNAHLFDKIEYSEQPIEIKLAEGVVVHGRIDLIRRIDTKEVIIIDFKSTDRAQEENVTRQQLHIYAMGYQQLTGSSADLVEIYNLDEGAGVSKRELVDEAMLRTTEVAIVAAGRDIRNNHLCRVERCNGCDFTGICRSDVASESAAS